MDNGSTLLCRSLVAAGGRYDAYVKGQQVFSQHRALRIAVVTGWLAGASEGSTGHATRQQSQASSIKARLCIAALGDILHLPGTGELSHQIVEASGRAVASATFSAILGDCSRPPDAVLHRLPTLRLAPPTVPAAAAAGADGDFSADFHASDGETHSDADDDGAQAEDETALTTAWSRLAETRAAGAAQAAGRARRRFVNTTLALVLLMEALIKRCNTSWAKWEQLKADGWKDLFDGTEAEEFSKSDASPTRSLSLEMLERFVSLLPPGPAGDLQAFALMCTVDFAVVSFLKPEEGYSFVPRQADWTDAGPLRCVRTSIAVDSEELVKRVRYSEQNIAWLMNVQAMLEATPVGDIPHSSTLSYGADTEPWCCGAHISICSHFNVESSPTIVPSDLRPSTRSNGGECGVVWVRLGRLQATTANGVYLGLRLREPKAAAIDGAAVLAP